MPWPTGFHDMPKTAVNSMGVALQFKAVWLLNVRFSRHDLNTGPKWIKRDISSGLWSYSEDLKSRLGWIGNGLDFKWDLKSGSPNIWNLNKLSLFCQKPFEILTKMSGFWMVFEWFHMAIAKARPSKSLDFKCFQILNGQI